VKISGRKQYVGSGKYDYIDETGKIFQVDIPKVTTDKSGKTLATGNITAEDEFMLNPFYHFIGKLTLLSDEKYSEFDGVARIVEECETLHPDWFSFKAPVNPADIKLPVSEAPVNRNNGKIFNGLFLTNDSAHIYPAFFSRKKNYSDNQLIRAHGQLYYDKDSMIYFIAPEGKLANRDSLGNILAFNRDACLLSGEGKISLGVDLGRVKTDVVGKITHNMNNKETSLDVMMAVDFLFDDKLAAMVAGKIGSSPSQEGVNISRPRFIRGMNEWLGMEKAATYRRDALLGNVLNFPQELSHTLVLTQLTLNWNQSSRSFRSTGKIGVGNLFGHQVNRLVDGVVEISKRPGGDFMDIYLKIDNNNWFYFGYTRELMQIISSDDSFNEELIKIPEKQRKMEEKRPGYTYMIASSDKLQQFLRQSGQQGTSPVTEPDPDQRPVINKPVQQPAPVQQPPVKKEEEEIPIIEIE
jgi:hypothetical protein